MTQDAHGLRQGSWYGFDPGVGPPLRPIVAADEAPRHTFSSSMNRFKFTNPWKATGNTAEPHSLQLHRGEGGGAAPDPADINQFISFRFLFNFGKPISNIVDIWAHNYNYYMLNEDVLDFEKLRISCKINLKTFEIKLVSKSKTRLLLHRQKNDFWRKVLVDEESVDPKVKWFLMGNSFYLACSWYCMPDMVYVDAHFRVSRFCLGRGDWTAQLKDHLAVGHCSWWIYYVWPEGSVEMLDDREL